MSVGNESGVVAVATERGIDVVLNCESKRETPAVVCFGGKQRFIGTAGAACISFNPNNTISQIKWLIGRRFSDPELQRDLKTLPFMVTEGPDGYPLIHARYLKKNKVFTPIQVLAMVLSDLKRIAEKNLNAAVMDCCIGIPVYFTDLQRRVVIDAATIAGLNTLRLIHETTATALAYGIEKTDLPENEPLNIAFVDVGHSSLQVCIAAFKKGQMKILSHSFDHSLGGRDIDEVFLQYVAEKVKDKFKIDVYQDVTKCLRLRAALEKLKKVLSVNLEETLNIGFLFGEKDFSFVVKRQLFEKIIVPILERVEKLLAKALADARLTVENIYSVEVVGLGSQVPAIIKILTDFFRMEPRRTMDAIECVAKGCALQCAIMSPTFKDWEFQVKERFHYSISSTWNVSSGDAHPNVAMIIPKGNLIPTMKALIFERSDIVTLDLQYANASELHALAMISIYKFGPFPSTNSKKAKLKVVVRLNRHGILSVESATLLEEEEVEVSVSKASDKETDAQVEAMNKKVIEINVPVLEIVLGALSTLDVQKFVEVEHEMALQDRAMEEAEDKKKAFEIYASDMFQKFFGEYHDFVTDPVRDKLAQQFYEVYSEVANAEVEAKDVYVAKLEELKKKGYLSLF